MAPLDRSKRPKASSSRELLAHLKKASSQKQASLAPRPFQQHSTTLRLCPRTQVLRKIPVLSSALQIVEDTPRRSSITQKSCKGQSATMLGPRQDAFSHALQSTSREVHAITGQEPKELSTHWSNGARLAESVRVSESKKGRSLVAD